MNEGRVCSPETRAKMSKANKGKQYALGNRGGHGKPTLYNDQVHIIMWDYLQKTKDEKVKTMNGVKIMPNIPMLCVVAIDIGVDEETMLDWHNKIKKKSSSEREPHEDSYLGAYFAIKIEQRKRLINNGLGGGYNGGMAKFLLAANHGMTERVDHTSDGEKVSAFGLGHAELRKLEIY